MNQNKLQVSGQFLYSFTVVAKHMSFTKAAEDLCITQSAVSHRIRCLEQELGFPLFHRLTRKIILTEEGKTLYGALDASIKQIHETIRNIQEAKLQGDLVIACAPSIAGCWLLPLLPEFQHEHPSISLHIRSGNDLISYENEEGNADVAIYCGDSITDGLHATPLLRDNLLPVCSQRYAREHDLIENPEALRNCELIHEHPEAANTPFYAGWEIWANWAGITGLPLQSGYSFDRAELTAIAAKQGLGVALGREWLVREALQKKELIVPFNLVFPAPQTYYVVSTRKGIQRPKVRLFHDWILEKARHSKPYGNAVL